MNTLNMSLISISGIFHIFQVSSDVGSKSIFIIFPPSWYHFYVSLKIKDFSLVYWNKIKNYFEAKNDSRGKFEGASEWNPIRKNGYNQRKSSESVQKFSHF